MNGHTKAIDLPAQTSISQSGGHLHGPWRDVLLLGGASVIAFLLISALDPTVSHAVTLGIVMMVLANFVNHPHFAHSYQMFYGTWRELRAGALPPALKVRWFVAGVVLPVALALWLGVAGWRWTQGDAWLMAVSINLLGALVGWHYVKQGFGMAMLDAALKKKYWTPEARKALLWNAYACWFASWALLNLSKAGSAYWGFFGIGMDLSQPVVASVCMVAALTTLWATFVAIKDLSRWPLELHHWSELPIGGLVAYFVTLYLWTVFSWANPTYALVIPFFHSLQYLTVVWRYKKNEIGAQHNAKRNSLVRFWIYGVVLGALGFWVVPAGIDFARFGFVPYPSTMGPPALAFATIWIFINIHHYLIDNVLWRQGNPKINQFLFQADPKA